MDRAGHEFDHRAFSRRRNTPCRVEVDSHIERGRKRLVAPSVESAEGAAIALFRRFPPYDSARDGLGLLRCRPRLGTNHSLVTLIALFTFLRHGTSQDVRTSQTVIYLQPDGIGSEDFRKCVIV